MTRNVSLILDIYGPCDENNSFPLLENICKTDPKLVSCQIYLHESGWRDGPDCKGKASGDMNGSCPGIVIMLENQINDFFRIGREKGYRFNEGMRLYSCAPIEVDSRYKGGDDVYGYY